MTVTVKWLGHAAVQLDYEGTTVVIDPFFSGNPKFPGDEHRPDNIDLLLITHGHNDHFGDAVDLIKKHNPTVVVIHEMSVYLNQRAPDADNIVGMNFGGTFVHDDSGIEVTMVPSSHSAGYQDGSGDIMYLGTPGGYVLTFPDGNSFYHCGDTAVTQEMKITADLFNPKIGLLAIGGHYTMDPRGAAYAAKMMDLDSVVPIHYGTFVPPLVGTPEELSQELEGTGIEVKGINPGDSFQV